MSFTTNITANGDAVLGTDAKGALEIPRGTTLQRPSSPRLNVGMIRWNTTLKAIEFHLGNGEWDNLLTVKNGDIRYVVVNNANIRSTLNMNNNIIRNVANPVLDFDAVNKKYLEWRVTEGYIDADALGGKLPAAYALSDTRIVAGPGLTGGGNLTTNRTISMLEPEEVTFTSVNEATMTGHTHKLVLTKANLDTIVGYELKEAEVIAGNGLIGGGKGPVTIDLGIPGLVSLQAPNEATADSHSHTLVLTKADIKTVLDYNPASEDNEVIAGGGLTGGGKLKDNPIIAMKMPKSISLTSNNSIDSDGHTHDLDLDADMIRGIIFPPITDQSPELPIGSYIVGTVNGQRNIDKAVNPTALYPMSKSGQFYYAHEDRNATGNVPGKWQFRGSIPSFAGITYERYSAGEYFYQYYSLWQRMQ